MITIHSIVEGHGEEEAFPIVLSRIAGSLEPRPVFRIGEVIRKPKSALIRRESQVLEKAIELLARKASEKAFIVCLIDSDKMCPAQDAPLLLMRATAVRPDIPKSVVLAYREFESWFIAAAESLRGKCDLLESFQTIDDPESLSGCKGYIGKYKINGKYIETIDQPAFARVFDLQQARRAKSFDKLVRDITRIINEISSR